MQVERKECYLLTDVTQGSGEDATGARLPSERLPHQHEAVTHDHHLVNLKDLLHEEVSHLQVHLLAVLFNGLQQDTVVRFGEFYTRKKVCSDPLKQMGRKVLLKKNNNHFKWSEIKIQILLHKHEIDISSNH